MIKMNVFAVYGIKLVVELGGKSCYNKRHAITIGAASPLAQQNRCYNGCAAGYE